MTARVVPDDAAGRADAIDVLRSGGIVGLPTDTVYGIAVDLAIPGGLERLFAAKRRPADRAVVLLLADLDQAAAVGDWPPAAAALGAAFWPGGLTIVVRQRTDAPLPRGLTGGAPTIGLRLPDHAAPRTLAAAVGPLPTTSANVSGLAEANDAAAIRDQLGNAIELVLDGGPARGGLASTIVDCSGEEPRILRAGAVPTAAVAAALDGVGIRHSIAAERRPR